MFGSGVRALRAALCVGLVVTNASFGSMDKVIVADNQEMYRAGVASLLSGNGGDRAISQFSDWVRLFTAVARDRESLIVVSTSLIPELELLVARARKACSRVLLIAEDDDSLGRYSARGVSGIVHRSSSPTAFLEVVRKIREGVGFALPTEETQTVRLCGTRFAKHLTPRELRIVGLLMEGLKNRRIADHLHMAEHAVRSKFQKIYEKTGFSNRLELALYISHHSDNPPTGQQIW